MRHQPVPLTRQGLRDAFGDVIPEESVLQRSEFLLPLDERTRQLYWNVLHPDWDKPTVH